MISRLIGFGLERLRRVEDRMEKSLVQTFREELVLESPTLKDYVAAHCVSDEFALSFLDYVGDYIYRYKRNDRYKSPIEFGKAVLEAAMTYNEVKEVRS
jgi:hypothetical protein